MPNTAEHVRLAEATGRAEDDLFNANPWYEWGPYLSERAWGTVREDYSADGNAWESFPHDHARSRAYRWNEDGMAGVSDIRHELCLAVALWNGRDPILKERMFGLTGPQGNHGEDAKEYWWYLEGLPSHALLRWRYHYPQAPFPYERLVHHGRGLHDPELELLDTGVFDESRFWSVEVSYAKRSPTELLLRIELENHGPEEATLQVLPTLWFRNTWSWDGSGDAAADRTGRLGAARVGAPARGLPARRGRRAGRRRPRGALLRERDERAAGVRLGGDDAVPEGRDQRPRRLGRSDGQPGRRRQQSRVALPRHARAGRQGRAAAEAAPAGRRGGEGRLGGGRIRRARGRARGRRRRVLPRARAGRHDAGGDAGAAAVVCRARLEQADLSVQRAALARRRPRSAAAPAVAPLRPQQRLAAPRRVRRAGDARSLGVPLVRRLGPRLPLHPVGAPRPGVREVPAARAAARVVPAPERCAAGVRVELRRRQPARARDGGPARVRDRRRSRPRVPGARLPEAADQLHLVAQPRGRRRQQRLQRRLPRARQHQPRRPLEPAPRARRSSRPTAPPGWPTTRSRCS